MPGSGWGSGGGVSAITAGNNITISPSGGAGNVTINAVPSGASGSIQFATSGAFASDNASLFWDDSSNMLGIGTNSPDEAVHLSFTGASKVLIETSTLDTNIALGFKGPSAEWQIGSNRVGLAGDNDNLYFRHSNSSTNVIVCEPGGNIGIGINNPTEMLHVVGNIRATGNITLGAGASFFLDGGSNTLLREVSTDTIGFITGGTSRTTISTSTLDAAVDINTQAGKVYKQSGNSGTGGNGTTFTFGGGGSGDIASLTIAGGIVTGTTTVP